MSNNVPEENTNLFKVYNQFTEGYSDGNTPWIKGILLTLLNELLKEKSDARILEVGAGGGALGEQILKNTSAQEYFAVDGSEPMTMMAKSRLEKLKNTDQLAEGQRFFVVNADFTGGSLKGLESNCDIAIQIGTGDYKTFYENLYHAIKYVKDGGYVINGEFYLRSEDSKINKDAESTFDFFKQYGQNRVGFILQSVVNLLKSKGGIDYFKMAFSKKFRDEIGNVDRPKIEDILTLAQLFPDAIKLGMTRDLGFPFALIVIHKTPELMNFLETRLNSIEG
ncbi:MAG: class I SAM-dependent methyltransferase [Candidatus Dojkabacteria bacterium]